MSVKTLNVEEMSRDELIELVKKLYEENQKLQKELKKYKNPHTPPSKNKFDKPQAQGLKVGRKAGKKSNHQGKTRAKEKPDIVVEVTTDMNPLTGNTHIEDTGHIAEIVITDFKIIKTVVQYNCHEYRDLNTGEVFIAKHPDMPKRGIFGKNILSFSNILHFENKVTFEGVANIFTEVFDIPMTAPTAMDICNRVAEKVSYKYEELRQDIRRETVVNGDETGSNQNGIQEWLWGFFTLSIAFFTFFEKRGGEIIDKVLGKNFKGILGCDGWSTYKVFSEKHGILLQRCWAHLIREVKHLCKDVKGLHDAYLWICDIFEKVKKARKLKSKKLREKIYNDLVGELDNWISVYSSYREMGEIITKVKNGKNFWFTCVLYPEVEPTNNRAERGLRFFVIFEKIIGCLRSGQGKRTTEIMMSLIQTWKLRGLNPYRELRDIV